MKPKKSRSRKTAKAASQSSRLQRAAPAKTTASRRKTPAAKRKAAPKRPAKKLEPLIAIEATAPEPKPAKAKRAPARKRRLESRPAPLETRMPAPATITGLEQKPAPTPSLAEQPPPLRREISRKEPAPARPPLRIPPILLEGDETLPPVAGPGQKYALGPTLPFHPPEPEEGELPEAYGTGQLLLAARDPHCLYAHWDLTAEQQRQYNALSRHHHLVVRVYPETAAGRPASELHVHPESRHWFIHVERAGVIYFAELGYYAPNGQWRAIAVSEPVTTPREAVAEEKTVQFATLRVEELLPRVAEPAPAPVAEAVPPPSLPAERVPAPPVEPTREWQPRAAAPQPFQGAARPVPELDGRPVAWAPTAGAPAEWTPAQERALAEVIRQVMLRHEWPGSAEIAELMRQAEQRVPAAAPEQFGWPVPLGISSPMGQIQAWEISSPPGGEMPEQRGFWFNVNAELVIYGATEPDAHVTIGGRPIRLRPDGSFSYRFALPDGTYQLPIQAASAHGDTRQARLSFHRSTQYQGEVGAHPQDPALKRPSAENVA